MLYYSSSSGYQVCSYGLSRTLEQAIHHAHSPAFRDKPRRERNETCGRKTGRLKTAPWILISKSGLLCQLNVKQQRPSWVEFKSACPCGGGCCCGDHYPPKLEWQKSRKRMRLPLGGLGRNSVRHIQFLLPWELPSIKPQG